MIEVGGAVGVDAQRVQEHLEVRLAGPLNLSTMLPVGRSLLQLLSAGQVVLADLSRLELGWAPATRVFDMALQAAGGWPSARLVLFGADPPMATALQALHVSDRVPLVRDHTTARTRMDGRPDLVERHLNLRKHPASARVARSAVVAACREWRMPSLATDLMLVTNELVNNAVQHAESAPRMSITLGPREVTVAVRDDLRCAAPRPQLSCAGSPCGRGLQMVAVLATRWGVVPHDDGKTVWASLSIDPPRTTGGSSATSGRRPRRPAGRRRGPGGTADAAAGARRVRRGRHRGRRGRRR